MVAYRTGDHERATGLHQQALDLSEQVGDRRLQVAALVNLGLAAARHPDYPVAARDLLRGLAVAEAIGERRSVAECLEELGAVEAAAGHPARAATLLGASQAIREDMGAPVPEPDLVRLGQAAAAAGQALGAEEFAARTLAGGGCPAAQAVTFAQDGPWPPAGQDAATR